MPQPRKPHICNNIYGMLLKHRTLSAFCVESADTFIECPILETDILLHVPIEEKWL
jgi:hypothetical protein